MAVRVRDLEIALVLAREMKAAAERSVDASLRLDQLQEVFGVQELDRAERARIQTALQMAGLEPFPSLLEADPSEPIRFGASKTAVAASGGSAAAPPPPPPPSPAEEPAETEAQPTFPTVGEFARSKLRSRRFGVRRGDHGEDEAPPPPEPPEPMAEANGHLPDEEAIEDEEVVDEEPVADDEELYDEPEPPADPEPEPEPEPEHEEREYIPLATPEPVAYEEPEPEPQPARARAGEVAAVLLPAVAIPVIATSIAGWRFGLPFVALSVIATGWVVGREKSGFFASIRGSRAARTALTVTAIVTVLSVGAAVVLAALRDSSTTTKKPATPAKQPAKPPAASKPATPPPSKAHKKKHKAKRATAPTPAPSQDPATQGLIRVPPSGGGGTTTTP